MADSERSGNEPTQHSLLSTQHSLGVLLLHGLTSSRATVDGLVPHLEARGLPWELPTLRGHHTRPEDLHGVTWHGWYEDGERALDDLLARCDRAVVVGLSMGGLVALHLAASRPERLAGVATVAAALRPIIPGAFLLPLLGRTRASAPFRGERAFLGRGLAAGSGNYPRAPLASLATLVRFARLVEAELPRVRAPLLICYTPHDRLVRPESARIIHDRAGTPPDRKRLLAFDRSGHEMLLDQQCEEVCAAIMAFIEGRADEPAGDNA